MIRVGTAGWSYADWEGRVTPRKKPRGFHALAHLSKYLNSVELNSSFYALPRESNASLWVQHVAEHPTFRFTAKLFQGFTHGADLSGAERQATVDSFHRGVQPLARSGRLLALLAQFPASFHRNGPNLSRLERIAGDFESHRLVLEVRHRSWFDREGLQAIERLGFCLATIDLPFAAEHPPEDVPQLGSLGYLRIHGRNKEAWFDPRAGRDQRYDYLYGASEVADLAGVARRLAATADEVVVITNNHFSGQAFTNALELMSILEGAPPLAPLELIEAFPRLRGKVRIDGQAPLF